MTQPFTLEYWEDDGWFVGRLKGVPGVFNQGQTLDELNQKPFENWSFGIRRKGVACEPGARASRRRGKRPSPLLRAAGSGLIRPQRTNMRRHGNSDSETDFGLEEKIRDAYQLMIEAEDAAPAGALAKDLVIDG